MLNWAILLVVLGLIAGYFAFATVVAGAWTFVFIAAFLILTLTGVTLIVRCWRDSRRTTFRTR